MATYSFNGFGPGQISTVSGNGISAGETLVLDPQWSAPQDAYGFSFQDLGYYADGDYFANELGDDLQQTLSVSDGDGNPVGSGLGYLEERITLTAPDGSTIDLYSIEIGGMAQGYIATAQILPGVHYDVASVTNVTPSDAPTYASLHSADYDADLANTLQASDGDELLYGGDGDDDIDAGLGDNTVYAGAGNDVIDDVHGALSGGNNLIYAEGGNDTVWAGAGSSTIYGGTGADSIDGETGSHLIYGGTDGDTIRGGDGNSTLYGESGDDSLMGEAGADLIYAGDGQDTVYGGTDSDTIYGQGDDDWVSAQDGDDLVYGGQGNDSLYGGEGHDEIYGDSDNDALYGGLGNDTLTGCTGDDSLYGGDGTDDLQGGAGNDSLSAGGSDDTLDGGTGADTLDGGYGADSLTGGAENDLLSGGAGNDTFGIVDGSGRDTVLDFDLLDDDDDGFTNDQLDVSGLTDLFGGTVQTWEVIVSDDGFGNALLTFPTGEEMVLTGLSPDVISEAGKLAAMGIPCFTSGTMIDTPQGARPVEQLAAGDLVTCSDGAARPILWVGGRRIGRAELAANPELLPVEIKAGVLGNRDPLRLSPQHAVALLHDGEERLARAKHLAARGQGKIRIAKGVRHVSYHHLLLPCHALVRANGAWVESLWPGPQALGALGPRARLEIALSQPQLIPALNGDGPAEAVYGPQVRPMMARKEVLALTTLTTKGAAKRKRPPKGPLAA